MSHQGEEEYPTCPVCQKGNLGGGVICRDCYNEKIKEGSKKKECGHRWRVGSGIGGIEKKKIVTIGLNVWCEKCNKKLKVWYKSK